MTAKRNILMMISRFPPHVGGTENQAYRLAKQLVQNGYQVDVLTQYMHAGDPRMEMMEGVRVIRSGFSWGSVLGSLIYILHGLYLIKRLGLKPDIIHAHMISAPAILACLSKRLLGAKIVVKVACSGPLGDIASSHKSLEGWIKLRYVFSNADHFISVSRDVAVELENAGVPKEKIAHIPNGVDTSEFRPVTSEAEKYKLMAELGLPQGRWILFSGRITDQKRPLFLLEAFRIVHQKIPDVRLLYIGDGDQREALDKKIAEYGLGDVVKMAIKQDQIHRFYQACDVFVLPSVAEGLSNSLLEAMSSGLVCVGSRVGGTLDLIVPNQNGCIFNGIEFDLAQVLIRVFSPDFFMNEVKSMARKTVENICDIKLIAGRYQSLYDALSLASSHG